MRNTRSRLGVRRLELGFASFRGRILALFIGLIAFAQISTLVAVLAATRSNVTRQQQDALAVGGRVVERLLNAREAELIDVAQQLSGDAAFLASVTDGDRAAIGSALERHRARTGAPLAALLGLDGTVVASVAPEPRELAPATSAPEPVRELLRRAEKDGFVTAASVIGSRPYQLVLLPIEVPQRIAWLSLGLPIDAALARELQRLTDLDVSFWGGAAGVEPAFFASTLGGRARMRLANALANRAAEKTSEPFLVRATQQLTLELPLGAAPHPRLHVVLQSSLAEALAPWRKLAAQQAALAAAALTLSMLAGFALAKRITQPVNTLVAGAQRILGGSYETAVEVTSRDELGLLARTFNEMQRSIADREARIVHQAQHDALTGLPNRLRAQQRIAQAVARARKSGGLLALLALDLRGLKAVNDAFGYAAGDQVLVQLARRLREAAGDATLLARLGSDEFLLALEGLPRDGVASAARRLLAAVRDPFAVEEARVEVGMHAGVALCPEHGDDADTLMRRADVALQDAKALRKDLAFYEAGRDERHLRQLALMRDLRLAIHEGALGIHYQPKVDLLTGEISQAEALVRWNHPERGAIPPDEFVALAERAGLIFDLTRHVLRGVARQWRTWTDRGLHLGLAVNLSPFDLTRPELPNVVHGVLEAYAMPPQALIFELTESGVMGDPHAAARMLQELRAEGLRVAIDDFGTGHSSLAQLKRMPVDELKIDKSFVKGLQKGSEDAAIVRSIVDLGHHLGLQVVAEGVEDAGAWDFLLASRCDMVQGYFVSRPLPAPDFEAFVREYAERSRS